jgi:hypothetical protein
MDSTTFELIVSIEDSRFVATIGALVDHAAQYAGSSSADAASFSSAVTEALAAALAGRTGSAPLPVVLRRQAGPLEVVVDGQTLTLDV